MAYASRTGTRRNLAELREAGWGLMVSTYGEWRDEGFPYAVDNGAWTAHTQGVPWDEGRFLGLLAVMGDGADFIAVPDIVEGGLNSLRLSESWLPRLPGDALKLVPVQDGMEPDDVAPLLADPMVGLFVGGSTEWKVTRLGDFARLCMDLSRWCHVGRVNSLKRIWLCATSGADSFDGSSASRYAVTCRKLDAARRQTALDFYREDNKR